MVAGWGGWGGRSAAGVRQFRTSELETCDGCGDQGRLVDSCACLEHNSLKAGNSDGTHLHCSHSKIVQELRCGFNAGHQEVVAGAGASDIKQVSFRVIDIF